MILQTLYRDPVTQLWSAAPCGSYRNFAYAADPHQPCRKPVAWSPLTPWLLARDHGESYDRAQCGAVVQHSANDAVARQIAAGVTVVSDCELGKVGYST